MKKLFVCFAVLTAMALMISCGGDNNENNGNESGNNGNNTSECTSGNFKCIGSESHYCNSNGSWVYDARCEDGCDSSTGKCIKNSGNDDSDTTSNTDHGDSDTSDSGNDNDHGDSSDSDPNLICTDEGSFRCYDDKIRQKCVSGTWTNFEECEYVCNSTTQQCEDDKGCKSGDYKCISGNSHYCSNNFWELNEKCPYDCDYNTGKCKDSECTTGEYLCGESTDSEHKYASYYCEKGYWKYYKTCPGECNKSTGLCEVTCVQAAGKTWTEKSYMTWQEAKDYCSKLTACGYSDWRLPTINELRTLIQNCSATQTGGECGVTDSCLSYNECCNSACSGCSYDYSGKYSKLGDTGFLWSSSVKSDSSDNAWYVDFYDGYVYYDGKSFTHSVRCVRQFVPHFCERSEAYFAHAGLREACAAL